MIFYILLLLVASNVLCIAQTKHTPNIDAAWDTVATLPDGIKRLVPGSTGSWPLFEFQNQPKVGFQYSYRLVNTEGEISWTKKLGVPITCYSTNKQGYCALVLDHTGNEPIDFRLDNEQGQLTGSTKFLFLLNPNGTVVWMVKIEDATGKPSLALSDNLDVYVQGISSRNGLLQLSYSDSEKTKSTLQIDPRSSTTILKFNLYGFIAAVLLLDQLYTERARISKIATAGANLVVLGGYSGSVMIGSVPLATHLSNSSFLAMIDESGSIRWVRDIDCRNVSTYPVDLVTSINRIFAVSSEESLQNQGTCYDLDNKRIYDLHFYARQGQIEKGTIIANIDNRNELFLSCQTNGNELFFSNCARESIHDHIITSEKSSSANDIWIVRIDSNGVVKNAVQHGGNGDDVLHNVLLGSRDGLYLLTYQNAGNGMRINGKVSTSTVNGFLWGIINRSSFD